MPRRKASTITPSSASHKRQICTVDTPITATSTPGSRRSKRIKASTKDSPSNKGKIVTARKSRYFGVLDSVDGEDGKRETSAVMQKEETSDCENDNAAASLASSSAFSTASSSNEEMSEPDDALRGRRKGQANARTHGKDFDETQSTAGEVAGKGKELWRQGVKTGLGPGKAIFIERPKPRGDGGIKYMPGIIHPNTMGFLGDLNANNDREWLKMHDADYRTAWKDWESFVESLTEKIIEKDDTIPELPPKDLVFRVYRDIRFSSDPTPYKPFFSAAWSRTGRKGPYAGYYVQIAPAEKSFVGCGLWMPEAAPLALLRTDIDRNPQNIKRVLMEPRVRKDILGVVANDEKKAVKAFVSQNGENALKTKPKGYNADNPNIELLRLKNFTIGRKLKDEEVVGPGCLDTIAELVGTMAPFVTYLNGVIMPDEGASSDVDGDAE